MARILAGALLLSTILIGSPAQAAGCQKVATGLPGGGACRYTATGPGVFAVATTSGYRVQYLRPGTTVWKTVAAQVAVPNQPQTGIAVTAGEIPSLPGDLVEVSIGTASSTTPGCPQAPPCYTTLSYQDGFIMGNDVG